MIGYGLNILCTYIVFSKKKFEKQNKSQTRKKDSDKLNVNIPRMGENSTDLRTRRFDRGHAYL